MSIVIGPGATDRSTNVDGAYTFILLGVPANGVGNLTSIEIFAFVGYPLVGCKVGTFYGTAPYFTCRDYATIGDVPAGSKQTFTEDSEGAPLAISVEVGDYIGIFFDTGYIESDASGGLGYYRESGDQMATGEQEYELVPTAILSLYGTGEVAAAKVSGGISLAALEALGLLGEH